MGPTLIALAVVAGFIVLVAVIIVFWGMGIYNGLVMKRNRFKNSFAQIDVQLKRRYDLIPNLVETAKGYLKHERETLEAVMAARAGAVAAHGPASADPTNAGAVQNLNAAEGVLGASLGRLMAVVEAYPNLKADQSMASLSEELTSTENKISFARQAYNDCVMDYNTSREVFPASLIAGSFNFQAAQSYEIDNQAQREAPKVAFT
jgi:LemA protein